MWSFERLRSVPEPDTAVRGLLRIRLGEGVSHWRKESYARQGETGPRGETARVIERTVARELFATGQSRVGLSLAEWLARASTLLLTRSPDMPADELQEYALACAANEGLGEMRPAPERVVAMLPQEPGTLIKGVVANWPPPDSAVRLVPIGDYLHAFNVTDADGILG